MSSIRRGEAGYVYATVNPSMPGLVKIGACTCLPDQRMKQLTAATASPTPFVLVHTRMVSDCTAVEGACHDLLARYRVNERREFFRVSERLAIATVDEAADPLAITDFVPREERRGESRPVKLPDLSFAELFATFEDRGDGVLNAEEQAACRALERSRRG